MTSLTGTDRRSCVASGQPCSVAGFTVPLCGSDDLSWDTASGAVPSTPCYTFLLDSEGGRFAFHSYLTSPLPAEDQSGPDAKCPGGEACAGTEYVAAVFSWLLHRKTTVAFASLRPGPHLHWVPTCSVCYQYLQFRHLLCALRHQKKQDDMCVAWGALHAWQPTWTEAW